jgi:hypothetical protein
MQSLAAVVEARPADDGADQEEGRDEMKCPHCAIHFHEDWQDGQFLNIDRKKPLFTRFKGNLRFWHYRFALCPACDDVTIQVAMRDGNDRPLEDWRQVYPIGANRGPSVVLANETFMLGDCCDSGNKSALLSATNLTWTATGTGKFAGRIRRW